MGWYYIPVSKVTACWDGSLGFSGPYKRRGFFHHSSAQVGSAYCPFSLLVGLVAVLLGVKLSSVKLTTFAPSSFEIMRAWSCTSIPSPVSMV